jgi:hypothetical protein
LNIAAFGGNMMQAYAVGMRSGAIDQQAEDQQAEDQQESDSSFLIQSDEDQQDEDGNVIVNLQDRPGVNVLGWQFGLRGRGNIVNPLTDVAMPFFLVMLNFFNIVFYNSNKTKGAR